MYINNIIMNYVIWGDVSFVNNLAGNPKVVGSNPRRSNLPLLCEKDVGLLHGYFVPSLSEQSVVAIDINLLFHYVYDNYVLIVP